MTWFTEYWLVRGNAAAADDDDTGLPNLFWWWDRENGIAGIIATQILPFCGKIPDLKIWRFRREEKRGRIGMEDDMLMLFKTDADVLGLWANIESAVYKDLQSKTAGGHGSWDGYHQEFVAKSE